jgi:hypothetical protein
MRLREKDNSSGRDIREYECPGCGYTDWKDSGPALWQVLSEDRGESEGTKARQNPPESKPLGRRILSLFHKDK